MLLLHCFNPCNKSPEKQFKLDSSCYDFSVTVVFMLGLPIVLLIRLVIDVRTDEQKGGKKKRAPLYSAHLSHVLSIK